MESILTSIKKLLGLEESYTHFDTDLIILINSILSILNQLGVGTDGYVITDKSGTWTAFLGAGGNFEAVKSYVYLRVKLMFDPPQSSALLESMNKMIQEYEWRAFVHYDPPEIPDTTVEDPVV